MLKRTLTYKNYDGETITEDFYFNFTKAELTMMELSESGGMSAMLERIVNEKDTKKIASIFEDIILKSVGKKSDDGKRFIKRGVAELFKETEAYSDLFMELILDEQKAADFVKAIMPPKAELDEVKAKTDAAISRFEASN